MILYIRVMSNLAHQELREAVRVRYYLATLGLGLGPALYTVGEMVHHQIPSLPALGAVLACTGLYLWIPGILGKMHLLRWTDDRLGLIGGAIAFLGLVAVTNIMLLQLVLVLIEQKAKNYPEVIAGVFHNVLFVTYIFGPAFPFGLLLLGVGLHRLKVFPPPVTYTYIFGVSTFPAGRFAGCPPVIHLSDLILTVGSMGIAWHLWKHPELWSRPRVG